MHPTHPRCTRPSGPVDDGNANLCEKMTIMMIMMITVPQPSSCSWLDDDHHHDHTHRHALGSIPMGGTFIPAAAAAASKTPLHIRVRYVYHTIKYHSCVPRVYDSPCMYDMSVPLLQMCASTYVRHVQMHMCNACTGLVAGSSHIRSKACMGLYSHRCTTDAVARSRCTGDARGGSDVCVCLLVHMCMLHVAVSYM